MSKRIAIAFLMLMGVLVSGAVVTPLIQGMGAVSVAAPIGSTWQTAKADATAATSSPYQPAGASTSTLIDLTPRFDQTYTAASFCCEYVSGQTLTTDPVIHVWGKVGGTNGDWVKLVDVNGSSSITLSDASTDYDNGTIKRTTPVTFADLQGCTQVLVTVSTAAVTSSGAASIKARGY